MEKYLISLALAAKYHDVVSFFNLSLVLFNYPLSLEISLLDTNTECALKCQNGYVQMD